MAGFFFRFGEIEERQPEKYPREIRGRFFANKFK